MKKEVEQAQCGLDLRVFLDQVKKTHELQEIQGAHWNKEIGALTEIYAGVPAPPALLFDEIPGYPRGYRVLSNVLMTPTREALALGMPTETTATEMVKAGGFNSAMVGKHGSRCESQLAKVSRSSMA